ncbi:MAG: GNAT family N-acetyltransferase [Planctomycetes bacterium]|nr:GNAT family N-acetyltransferase [Planctomycetota bacterium]
MHIDYAILTHPLPERFVEWYPYAKPSVMLPDSAHWLDSMQRVINDDLPGWVHHFSTARDADTDAYVGVAWLGLSPVTPELGHFGWFLVEEAYRGTGIGREVLNRALAFFDERNVEVVMLPTLLSTVHARGMYGRRGFVDLIAQQKDGRCWMIRGPESHFERHFITDGPISIGPMGEKDWLAFDYLLNHERLVSRLYPVGLTGERRVISLTRASEWEHGAREIAIRRGERMCGFIVVKESGGRVEADFYAPDESLAREAVRYMKQEYGERLTVTTALRDERKGRVLRANGMRQVKSFREKPFGREAEEGFAVWRPA